MCIFRSLYSYHVHGGHDAGLNGPLSIDGGLASTICELLENNCTKQGVLFTWQTRFNFQGCQCTLKGSSEESPYNHLLPQGPQDDDSSQSAS